MEIVVILVVLGLFGLLINEMAKVRNRNQVAWVVFSLLFSPILGVIALLLVGVKKEENNEQ